jgi:4-hydroxybenzoate polyprenyltransferase
VTFTDALSLGRVSNLPTVWTNMLVGLVLAGAGLAHPAIWPLFLALTLFYIGGMYLNDFFDAVIDARERPDRPIPAGRAKRSTVGAAGFGMLAAGIALMALVTARGGSPWPVLAAVALAGCIVLYDAHHKNNPLSPFVMGLCRILVYLCAGVSVVAPPPVALLVAASALLCYLIGLTYVAKQENLGRVANMWPLVFLAAPVMHGVSLALERPGVWVFLALFVIWVLVALRFVLRRGPGDIPRAVVSLIAGICLLDAVFIAATGQLVLASVCVAAFVLTLALQRYISGT